MRAAVARDPLRPGSQIYEQINAEVKAGLEGADREEFIQLFPSYRSFERSLSRSIVSSAHLYPFINIMRGENKTTKISCLTCRWRREHSPATPNTQEEIDVDIRFLLTLYHCVWVKTKLS